LSVVLVVAAGLFIRSFLSVVTRPMGFDPQRVLVVSIDSQRAGIDPLQRIDLYARVREAARSAAGVGGAAMSFLTPGGSGGFTPPVQISGVPLAQTQNGQVFANLISSQWFKVLGTRLVAGRDFTDLDRKGAPRVAVVNQSFERKFSGGTSALGRTISLYAGGTAAMPPMAIVGVVEDAIYNTPLEPVPPTWYAPLDQFDVPMALASPMFRVMNLNVSATSGPPALLTKNIADAISGVNPNLALTFRPLADQLHTALTQQRLMAWLAGAFGVVALLLAGLGLYGVTAYAVSRRRTEIGIRTALGAEPGRLVRMVLARVAGLVGVGVAAGTVMSVFLSPVVGSLMYGIGPRDPLIIAGAAMMLVVVGVAAGWLPARHVARIDPVSVLRES
jgi:putative ABC transport system permease protein